MPMDKQDCAFSPLRWINNVSSTTCFSLMSYANNKAKALRPTGHIQTAVLCLKWYTLTLICLLLPVTCYRRVETMSCLRYAFVLPSLCLRFRFAPIDGASTDLQRIYNGPTTELHRRGSRAFFASFPRFLCGVNEFSMMSTKSGLCKPFRENDNLSSMMSTNAV